MQIKLHANESTRNGDCARCESPQYTEKNKCEKANGPRPSTNTETEYIGIYVQMRVSHDFHHAFAPFCVPSGVFGRNNAIEQRPHATRVQPFNFCAIDHCLFWYLTAECSQCRNEFKSNHNLCLPEHERQMENDVVAELLKLTLCGSSQQSVGCYGSENKSPQTIAQYSCSTSAEQLLFYYFYFSMYLICNTKNGRPDEFIFIYMLYAH